MYIYIYIHIYVIFTSICIYIYVYDCICMYAHSVPSLSSSRRLVLRDKRDNCQRAYLGIQLFKESATKLDSIWSVVRSARWQWSLLSDLRGRLVALNENNTDWIYLGSVAPLSPVPFFPRCFRKHQTCIVREKMKQVLLWVSLCHSLEQQLPHGMVRNIAHSRHVLCQHESSTSLASLQTEHKLLERAVEPEAAGFVSFASVTSLLQLQAWYKHSACSWHDCCSVFRSWSKLTLEVLTLIGTRTGRH